MDNILIDEIEIIKRGTAEIISEEELIEKLKKFHQTGIPLNIKAGFDPSAPDLHFRSYCCFTENEAVSRTWTQRDFSNW